MSTFKSFIVSLLNLAKLSTATIEHLTSSSNINRFRTSFTHKSIDDKADRNYELTEIVGDSVINAIIISYIRTRFPSITNVDWITRLRNNSVSKEALAKISLNKGFLKWINIKDGGLEEDSNPYVRKRSIANTIIYNSRTNVKEPNSATIERIERGYVDFKKGMSEEQLKNAKEHMLTNEVFESLLEDTLESFIGTLQTIIDEYEGAKYPDLAIGGMLPGPGFAVCTYIIHYLFDEVDISIKYEDVFDPVTRIKTRVFDKYKWPFRSVFNTEQIIGDTEQYKTSVYMFPQGTDITDRRNRVLIATSIKPSKSGTQGSEMTAAASAIEYLSSRCDIKITPLDPFTKKQNP